ncbi:hypothetical protein [Kribbella sp. CA-294648]|uniref:hypothetical protein n=1 Tax=Kribbella sp. CA-294648 TaxID=3239948 RepID=UPI003D8CE909
MITHSNGAESYRLDKPILTAGNRQIAVCLTQSATSNGVIVRECVKYGSRTS